MYTYFHTYIPNILICVVPYLRKYVPYMPKGVSFPHTYMHTYILIFESRG